jgi:hypothetical protein
VMKGPRSARQLTDTTVMTFHSGDARDSALKIIRDAKAQVLDGNKPLDLKIEYARTRAQKARNWAIRKAEELIKVEMSKRSGKKSIKIDWTMPTRKIVFNDTEVVFQQEKEELRGKFLGSFAKLSLPP